MFKYHHLWELIFLLLTTVVCWKYALHLHSQSLLDVQSNSTNIHSPLLNDAVRTFGTSQITDQCENMFHFVQVTDLHVSRYSKVGGLAHLKVFLKNELPLIAPDLVLCTGDLTDAKSSHTLTSIQHREEWVAYHSALDNSSVLLRQDSRFWWDQRGNHDCWNIPAFKSSENMYRTLSAVQKEGYAFELKKDFGTYSFIALDGCPETGAGRPLNFFGYFDTKDMDFLATSLIKSIHGNHNHTFGMSHYPTGTTLFGKTSDGIGFWQLSHHFSIWFCGHLHKLAGGLGETMYAYQDNSMLELELGDLKTHGLFRIIVVDHDLISFVDLPIDSPKIPLGKNQNFEFNRAPIVLITNPKDARFIIPGREPTYLIKTSTHIRVMIWSLKKIKKVTTFIDDHLFESPARYNGIGNPWSSIQSLDEQEPNLPLYVIKWNPLDYNDDLDHVLTVVAEDEFGLKANHTVKFRFDGQRITDMEAGPGGFIISIPFGLVFKDLFLLFYVVVTVIFLLIPKLFVLMTDMVDTYQFWKNQTSKMLISIDQNSQLYNRMLFPSVRQRLQHRWNDFKFTMVGSFLRFCELSRKKDIFYPLYLFSLYITVGPWFIGDFVPNSDFEGKRYGWLMTYGIWFDDGRWEPVLDTWVFAWYGLLYALFPLTFYLSFCVTKPTLLYAASNIRVTSPIHTRWYSKLIVGFALVYHLLDTVSYSIFYGYQATLLSPGKTWISLWAIYKLWHLSFDPKLPSVVVKVEKSQ
ncbi:Metallo-dependent phosphatase-like protein [Globomyces pollinis-pini]|nr:Metallo-dependent phosphatase-like protein [Globomyces pollinis-pini]